VIVLCARFAKAAAQRRWAMMLLGFAGLGFMSYRRTKESAAV
jgi:hypothetical protein